MPDEPTTKPHRPPSRKATIEDREDFVAAEPVVTLRFMGQPGNDAFVYQGYDYDAAPLTAAKGQTFDCSAAMAKNLMHTEETVKPKPGDESERPEMVPHHTFEVVKGK